MHIIYYATSNMRKFTEVYDFMKMYCPAITIKQAPLELIEIQSDDSQAIAISKAQQAYAALKHPVLVDDAGIYLTNYKNFPGTFSKWIYYSIGMEGLIKFINPGDKAFVLLSLVYVWGPDQYQAFEGKCEGSVVHPDSMQFSAKGFYDRLFVPEGTDKTYAQLDLSGVDAQYSYRIRALKQFLSWYATHSGGTVQDKQQLPTLES